MSQQTVIGELKLRKSDLGVSGSISKDRRPLFVPLESSRSLLQVTFSDIKALCNFYQNKIIYILLKGKQFCVIVKHCWNNLFVSCPKWMTQIGAMALLFLLLFPTRWKKKKLTACNHGHFIEWMKKSTSEKANNSHIYCKVYTQCNKMLIWNSL